MNLAPVFFALKDLYFRDENGLRQLQFAWRKSRL